MYNEDLRPQFHFTAATGWLNDPNGLVYYDAKPSEATKGEGRGVYHLFFQHNPFSTKWGNMTWGHAVSRDLLHWEQLPNALEPDAMGTMYSGSAIVDWNNTAGFGREAIVAFYTAEGGCLEPKVPTTQCLAYSIDGGKTLIKYADNPIIDEITPGNRDPKVFWWTNADNCSPITDNSPGTPRGYWVMVLYVKKNSTHTIQFFRSDDLKKWNYMSEVEGFYECPDFFPLTTHPRSSSTKNEAPRTKNPEPGTRNPEQNTWILFGADGHYALGDFDGTEFKIREGKRINDYGANMYAAQTYSDIPAEDGRRIIIGWMRGGDYPHMPFNQQMTIPCELSLDNGVLCKLPVRELEAQRIATHESDEVLGDLFDIEADIEPTGDLDVGFDIRGYPVRYLCGEQVLLVGRQYAPLPMENGRIRLRILVDRSSVEVFGNGGKVVVSNCFLPPADNRSIRYRATGLAKVHKLLMHKLASCW